MESLMFEKMREIRKERLALEKALEVKITLRGRQVIMEGDSFKEFEAKRVLEAIQFGFSAKKALMLLDEDMIFRPLMMKNFTRRKNMYDVRSRIIGKEGKTKRTIEEITGCFLVIREDNQVGVIGNAEVIDEATTAITNIIKGSKHANAYNFLERMNSRKKKLGKDLGLKEDEKSEEDKAELDEKDEDMDEEEESL